MRTKWFVALSALALAGVMQAQVVTAQEGQVLTGGGAHVSVDAFGSPTRLGRWVP